MAVAVRQCSATTKAGEPCPVAPLNGMETCLAHAPDDVRVSRRFDGSAGHLGGRPKVRRWHELVNQKLEEEAEAFVRPYLDALHGDDRDLAMRAVERLLDRLDGKPTQRTETELSGTIGLDLLLADQPNDNADNTKFEEEA